MKEQPKAKDLRHVRVARSEHTQIHDDSGHLWAVSYSDFLMVLLCFFILFFSTSPEKKDNLIHKIFTDIKGDGSTGPSAGAGSNPGSKGNADGRFPAASLEKDLQNFSVSVTEKEAGLLIHFPDDLYSAGSFEIKPAQARSLETFMEKINPYRDQITLTFVGHADSTPVDAQRKRIFTDNFDLSSLRATRALQYAARSGFPEDQMTARGTSKNARASRSISVLIRPKGDLL